MFVFYAIYMVFSYSIFPIYATVLFAIFKYLLSSYLPNKSFNSNIYSLYPLSLCFNEYEPDKLRLINVSLSSPFGTKYYVLLLLASVTII